uniref:Nephronectin a n=1 Tax=Cyprinus carpio TaxID=7962 RepID=A0A8C2EPW9_CYPCA
MNTPGSYKCYCLNGYMMMADGTCRNAHTCAMANCQYGCAVMKGKVRCQCPSPGLRLAPDGRTCVDVDECVSGQVSCPRFRKCVNTFGSYVCRCHEGFELRHINGKYHLCSVCLSDAVCVSAVVKVTIEPARPGEVTVSPTTISTATAPMTTTRETTTTKTTTTATPTTTVTIATSVPTSTALTTVTPTTVAIATTATTTTAFTTVAMTTSPTTTSTSPTPTTIDTFPTTTTIKTTTTTAQMSSTTTLDNRIHRENTAKPRGDVHNGEDLTHVCVCVCVCVCVSAAAVVSCSFDEGLCVWMTDSEGDLKWEIKDDPAGGRYLSVPEAPNRRSVKGARLTVPLAPPTKAWQGGDLCLSFKHRLHGHHIGSLQVFVRKGRSHNPSIWTRTGGHGWRHAHITLWGRGLVDVSMNKSSCVHTYFKNAEVFSPTRISQFLFIYYNFCDQNDRFCGASFQNAINFFCALPNPDLVFRHKINNCKIKHCILFIYELICMFLFHTKVVFFCIFFHN